MPAFLLSLLPLLGRLAPDLVGLGFGGHAPAVAGAVETALRDLFGTVDPEAVQAAVDGDPAKAAALRSRLSAATESLKADLAAAVARSAPLAAAQAASPSAWGSPIISVIVVAAFAAVAVLVFGRFGVDSAVGQLIAGALIAKFGTVVDYWLGSSKGSSDRADQVTAMLHQAIGGLPRAAGARP